MSYRSDKVDVLFGVAVTALLATGAFLPPVVGGVVTGVATELLAGLIDRNWDSVRSRLLSNEGMLDPDLQKVMQRAFIRAVEKLEKLWWVSPSGAHLRRSSGDVSDSVEAMFRMLRDDVAIVLAEERLGVLATDAEAARAICGNQTELQQALNQAIARYLYGHDEQLISFVRRNLVPQLAQCVVEELSADTPEGRRAWRRFEYIVLVGLQTNTSELLIQQSDLARKINDWASNVQTRDQTEQEEVRQKILGSVVLETGELLMIALTEQFDRSRDEIRGWLDTTTEAIASEAAQTRLGNRVEHEQTRTELADLVNHATSRINQGFAGLRLDLGLSQESAMPVSSEGTAAQELSGSAKLRIRSLPHRPSRLLVGREDLLQELERHLVPMNQSPSTVILWGIGGVGKTEVASTFAHRHAPEFSVVWTINADTPTKLAEDFAKLGLELGLPEANSSDLSDVAGAIRKWLEHADDPWLLIFENANDEGEIGPYLPSLGNGRIIITSRDAAWSRLGQPLHVQPLSEMEGATYLLQSTGDLDAAAARELASEFGGLPIALVQAAAHVEATHLSLRGFLELFRTHNLRLLEEMPSVDASIRSVATIWDLALRKIEEESPEAAQLLTFFSVLSPDSIPLEVISKYRGLFPEPLSSALNDEIAVTRVVRTLLKHSLVEVIDDRTLALHRLVQIVMRDRLTGEELKDRACAAIDLVTAAFPIPPDDVAAWPAAERLTAHGLMALGILEATNTIYFDGGHIRGSIGLYLLARGQFGEAHRILSQSVQIGELVLNPNDPALAKRYANLAAAELAQGSIPTAVQLLERAVAIERASLSPNHPQLATDLSNLATALLDQGDLPGARQRIEQALAIHTGVLGPEHTDVGIDLNNLGIVVSKQGFHREAAVLLQRALAIAETTDGPSHPRVANRLVSLASVHREMGELDEARQLLERAVLIDERAFGLEHPKVSSDLHALAEILGAQGNHSAARPLLERALHIDESNPNATSLQIATSLTEVGIVRMNLADSDGAKPMLERALALRESGLGPNHPGVAASLNNLACAMCAQGNLLDAQQLFERAMTIWEQAGDEPMAARISEVIARIEELTAMQVGGQSPSLGCRG